MENLPQQTFPDEAKTSPNTPSLRAELAAIQEELDGALVDIEHSMYTAMQTASTKLDELVARLEKGAAA